MSNHETLARLSRPLPGFEEPDTSSQREGRVQPGDYRVLRTTPGADGESDYALLAIDAVEDSDTWICCRWKNSVYAELVEQELAAVPAPVDRSDQEDSIPESALVDLIPEFGSFKYVPSGARYPFALRGKKLPLAPPAVNNCCTFVEAIVVGAWQRHFPSDFEWSARLHGQMMINSTEDYYSPISALLDAGMAEAIDPEVPPSPWSVIQGWRTQWTRGHTFIVVDVHPENRRVLTLESNSAYELNGVGFRGIGNASLIESGAAPTNWWESDDVWTWEKFRSTYPFRRACTLRVSDASWARGYAG